MKLNIEIKEWNQKIHTIKKMIHDLNVCQNYNYKEIRNLIIKAEKIYV
ncbi:hypothetical protein I0592_002430, partial [Staphylococcus pseudintermedius]|nr:hypothetical protein [Staphylococcus pseudintermedius]